MNSQEYDDEDYHKDISEDEDAEELDDARRHREYKSDCERPY